MKTRMMGGKGGYGGITTMNQDQRGPRYAPHANVTTYTSISTDTTEVSCRDCGQRWAHPRGFREGTPPECRKSDILEKTLEEMPLRRIFYEKPEEGGIEFESYVTEDNEIRFRPRLVIADASGHNDWDKR